MARQSRIEEYIEGKISDFKRDPHAPVMGVRFVAVVMGVVVLLIAGLSLLSEPVLEADAHITSNLQIQYDGSGDYEMVDDTDTIAAFEQILHSYQRSLCKTAPETYNTADCSYCIMYEVDGATYQVVIGEELDHLSDGPGVDYSIRKHEEMLKELQELFGEK